jgi:HK97 family phage portal protein
MMTTELATRSEPPRTGGLRTRIRAALSSWLGIPIELTNARFWAEFSGAPAHSGERVTPDTALRMSAVWACVRLISETVSTLPILLYRRTPDRTVANKHPLYFILHDSPNADMTAVTFWETMLASMLLWGNAYAVIIRGGGVVVSLEFVHPAGVIVRRMPDGTLLYIWHDYLGKQYETDESDMLHVPAFTMNGLVGLSPIAYASNVLGNALAADHASGTLFRRGLMMSGTFETPNTVPEKLRTTFQARLEEYRGSINAGKAPLLEAGIKYNALSIHPDDAQLLETRAFSIEEICRWYRVPPFMVGHSEKSTSWGTGIEQQMIGFLTFTLRPWLKRIEQTINRKLLTPTERMDLYSEFNIEALLRADSTARAAFYSTMVQNGIYTRDECRAKENMAPFGGNADVLTAQVNLAPLDELGGAATASNAPAVQARNAVLAWLGIESEQNRAEHASAASMEQ